MKILSMITTTDNNTFATLRGWEWHVSGRPRIDPFDVLIENGDKVAVSEPFDILDNGVYLYGVRATSCIRHLEANEVRTVWTCIADGMAIVDSGTNIFTVRKTIALGKRT